MKIYISFVLFATILAMVSVRCTARQYGKRPAPPPLIMPTTPPELQEKRPRFGPPSPNSPFKTTTTTTKETTRWTFPPQSPGGRSPGGRNQSPGGRFGSPSGRFGSSGGLFGSPGRRSPGSPGVNGPRFTFPPNPSQHGGLWK
ncbi:hypothetical protein Aduo_000286 [Ancylostoma duodenale]